MNEHKCFDDVLADLERIKSRLLVIEECTYMYTCTSIKLDNVKDLMYGLSQICEGVMIDLEKSIGFIRNESAGD